MSGGFQQNAPRKYEEILQSKLEQLIIYICQPDGNKWAKATAGLDIIVDRSNFGTYGFNAKGGELILVGSTGFASGGHDASASITVNGSICGRSQTNGHERAWGVYTNAFCTTSARKGSNTISASGTSRLIIVGG